MLKKKSDTNFCAAQLLHKNNHYSAVVHCAYYSCVQLMKYNWHINNNKSDDDFEKCQKTANAGTHAFLINETVKALSNKPKKRNFYNYIVDLKKLRIKADYKCIEIDENNSSSSIKLAEEIINILN